MQYNKKHTIINMLSPSSSALTNVIWKKKGFGLISRLLTQGINSLAVQWWGLCAFTAVAQVQELSPRWENY